MASQLYQVSACKSFFCVPKPTQNLLHISTQKSRLRGSIRCVANNKDTQVDNRLAVYQPTIWSHELIESLDTSFSTNSHTTMKGYMENESKLEEKVKELEDKVTALTDDYENGSSSTLQLLELLDNIERLGLGYRFQSYISSVLDKIASIHGVGLEEEVSLHAVSLRFRLLRQHGYNTSQDFLRKFKDKHGNFMQCVQTDAKGLLSLYEASYLGIEGEIELHEAKLFAIEHLLKLKGLQNQVMECITHALDLPLNRRMPRLQARWYIDAYDKRKDADLLLLELATSDFNLVQLTFKKDLQELSKWWRNIGLASKLSFIRDRLMECFFWAVGMVFEPQYHSCRVWLTKVGSLITIIDDIYDVYGSLDELEVFTDAVKRWDVNAVQHMPEYCQLCFLALYNTINEMGYKILMEQGKNIIPILQKVWGELSEAFLVEAKWTHSKYMPTLEDYLDNAWRSVSGVVILTHGYFLINQERKKDATESFEKFHDLLKWSSMIFRLCNDLGTASDEIERGKSVNAISCYMHENGVSEEIAREYIKTLIDEAWRKMIKARMACSLEVMDPFIEMAINLARISHCTYQHGDGHGAPDAKAKDRVLSVIIEPITMREKSNNII